VSPASSLKIIVHDLQDLFADFDLLSRHCPESLIKRLLREYHRLLLQSLPLFCEIDAVDPSVIVRCHAFHQVQLLEIVNQPRDAWLVPECGITQLLLTQALLFP